MVVLQCRVRLDTHNANVKAVVGFYTKQMVKVSLCADNPIRRMLMAHAMMSHVIVTSCMQCSGTCSARDIYTVTHLSVVTFMALTHA